MRSLGRWDWIAIGLGACLAWLLFYQPAFPADGFSKKDIENLPKVEAPTAVPPGFFSSRKNSLSHIRAEISQRQRSAIMFKAQQRRARTKYWDSVPTIDPAVETAKAWAASH